MGILFMATADLQTTSMWSLRNRMYVDSAYYRTGAYSFRTYDTSGYGETFFPGINEGYIRCALYPILTNTSSIRLYYGGGNQLALYFNSTGVHLRLGDFDDTVIDSSEVMSLAGKWNLIEWYWLIDNSVGVSQVKLDGTMIIDYSGDTRYNGTSDTVTSFKISSHINSGNTYWDDIILRDDDWPGQGGLHILAPNSGTTTEEWTASAGNPEDCVDEIPPSFTDYIYAPTTSSGVQHLVGIESLPFTAESVAGVAVYTNNKVDYATTANMKNIIKSGTTISEGSGYPVTVSEIWTPTYYDQNPDTAADWEDADINTLEIGVEIV